MNAPHFEEKQRLSIEQFFETFYLDLQRLALAVLRRRSPRNRLTSEALVHEAYLRLHHLELEIHDTAHCLALAARTMTFVLQDQAKALGRQRRGGGHLRVDLDTETLRSEAPRLEEWIALHEAFRVLGRASPRLRRVVESRYLDGLTLAETAERLDISTMTVKREWVLARKILRQVFRVGMPEA